MSRAEEFVEEFLKHAMSKEERAAYNREYYLKNRELKGRSRSGDDVRKPVKPSNLPKRDPKVYKELRARLGTLIRETKHIMVPMMKIVNSSTYTDKEKAEFNRLQEQLMPYYPRVLQLERDIKRAGFTAEFEKYDKHMPTPGRTNSLNPRSARR